MREVAYSDIVNSIKNLIMTTATNLPEDTVQALEKALEEEKSEVAKRGY